MVKKVLSINHSDSTGKTGIQNDLGSFQELDVFGFTVITSININQEQVLEVVDDLTIKRQFESVFALGQIDSIKLANLHSLETPILIKEFAEKYHVPYLILETPLKDLEQEINQTSIKALHPIVVLTETLDDSKESAKRLFQKEMTALVFPVKNFNDNFLLYNGDSFYSFNTSENVAAFLTSELATHQTLSHLLKLEK
ncbi:bifunctional hydroxymethylpyrimidine kinase/phosphomethylpyrimidine kinase [Vagococcus fluvialis]|uniref:bifunctional hydroxymethylpyrimidine kinase/phosphomethylpyrimidine kinase n=1 Tax=Vagococcus fluvialis TaxID=2738 RepID=UPI001A8D3B13|nr:bifunctional hydroxymethylpyrimidine kinase/phosphomethylpyrimidine kinase [Vagococcus fluvialis]MBO0429332.1 bifunctional hydroxymethylpyrimidine kinase/phosphomethylpyrimidine kinase [Vagococcus fluvialis]